MTDHNLTHLAIVLDRSGSMSEGGKAAEAERGVRALLREQRALPGELRVTVVSFDDGYDMLAFDLPAAEVDDSRLCIEPRGMTALFDAVGRTVTTLGSHLAVQPEDKRPGRVVVLVATDGLENASHEYTADRLRWLIGQQTDEYGWEFMFMGASQEAMLQARSVGFSANTTFAGSDTAAGVGSTYSVASATLTRARTTGTKVLVDDQDRSKLS